MDRWAGGRPLSGGAGVVRPRRQQDAVVVVGEQNQAVEVLAAQQEAVFVVIPAQRSVSKAMHSHRHPGLIQETPAGQVSQSHETQSCDLCVCVWVCVCVCVCVCVRACRSADLSCWMSR